MGDPLLTGRQRTTVAAALTTVSAVLVLLAVGSMLYLLGLFFTTFSNVLIPLAVAGILSLILKPFHGFLVKKFRCSSAVAVVLVYLGILLPIVGVAWFFGAILVDQATELFREMPAWWSAAKSWFIERLPVVESFLERHDLRARIRGAVGENAGDIVGVLQAVLTQTVASGLNAFQFVSGLLGWFVVPVYMFFFMQAKPIARKQQEAWLPFLREETRRDVLYLVHQFLEILVAFFRGQLVIAFLQGLLFGIGFSVCGLKYGFILGLLLGLLNIIPYLGSILGLAITLPLAYFQPDGGMTLLLLVIGVFVLVQAIEGYVLTPRIMGEQTGLHPLAIMVAIFFWGSALGGLAGMMLAIPLTAFLVVFWRLARDHYIKEIL